MKRTLILFLDVRVQCIWAHVWPSHTETGCEQRGGGNLHVSNSSCHQHPAPVPLFSPCRVLEGPAQGSLTFYCNRFENTSFGPSPFFSPPTLEMHIPRDLASLSLPSDSQVLGWFDQMVDQSLEGTLYLPSFFVLLIPPLPKLSTSSSCSSFLHFSPILFSFFPQHPESPQSILLAPIPTTHAGPLDSHSHPHSSLLICLDIVRFITLEDNAHFVSFSRLECYSCVMLSVLLG